MGRFATTRWSLVLAAGRRGSPGADEALARLCALYWPPVFAWLRRRGHDAADAEDLTQGFFTRLIEKGDLAHADPALGRFRSFLLTACKHYLSHERERESAQKRGGDRKLLPIDAGDADERYGRQLAHAETPEAAYERQWCLTLLAGVLDELREEYVVTGRERTFDRLKPFLTGDDSGSAQAAQDLGISVGAVRVAVHRLRSRYRAALRATVAATVASEDDVDDEIEYCLRVLSRG